MTQAQDKFEPDAYQLDAECQRIMADHARRQEARLASASAALKTDILPRLKQWHVAKVKAEYSGYGDSGCIDGITYLDAHDKPVNMAMVKTASDPEIETLLYRFLPAGFENNEGGQGTITVDVTAGTVTLKHQENYTEHHDSTQEFTL